MPDLTFLHFNNKMQEVRDEHKKTWTGAAKESAAFNLSWEEQRKIYHELIDGATSDIPILKSAFSDVLAAEKRRLQPNELVFSDLESRYEGAAFKQESQFSTDVMTELFGWLDHGVDEKLKKEKRCSPRGQYILGMERACEAILKEKDSAARLAAWMKLSEILEAIYYSEISGTKCYQEWFQSGFALTFSAWLGKTGKKKDTKNHFRNRVWCANEFIQKCIQQEKISQAQSAIRVYLDDLNRAMGSAVSLTTARLVSNLILANHQYQGGITNCHTMHSNHIDINNLVWLGLQEVMGFLTIKNSEYYADTNGKKSDSGDMVAEFNENLLLLHGSKIIQPTKKSDTSNEAKSLQSSSNEEHFSDFASLIERARFDEKGNLIVSKPDGKGKVVDHTILSGFNAFIVADKDKLRIAVKNYIDLLKCIKKLKNCLERNKEYHSFIAQLGDETAITILLGSDFCKDMEVESLSLMQEFKTKLVNFHMNAACTCLDDPAYATVSTPGHSVMVGNLGLASLGIKKIIKIVETVEDKTGLICKKRIQIQNQIKECTTCQKATETLLQKQADYCKKQQALGMNVKMLTSDEQSRALAVAKLHDAKTERSGNLSNDEVKQILAAENTTRNAALNDTSKSVQPAQGASNSGSNSSIAETSALPPDSILLSPVPLISLVVSPINNAAPAPALIVLSTRPVRIKKHGELKNSRENSDYDGNDNKHSDSTSSMTAAFLEHNVQRDNENKSTSQCNEQPLQSVFTELVNTPELTVRNKKIIAYTKNKFNNARKALGYENSKQELDPVALFKKYNLPKNEPVINKTASSEERFYAQLNAKNADVVALQNNMYIRRNWFKPWTWLKPWAWLGSWGWSENWAEDKRNIKAGRLVYCQEMVELFVQTMKNGNDFTSENSIDEMYGKVNEYLKKQKQWPDNRWRGVEFNLQINNLQLELANKKEEAKTEYVFLKELQASIKAPDSKDPEELLSQKEVRLLAIYEKLMLRPYSKLKNKVTGDLDNYIQLSLSKEFLSIGLSIDSESKSPERNQTTCMKISEKIEALNITIQRIDAVRIKAGLDSMQDSFKGMVSEYGGRLNELVGAILDDANFELEAIRVATFLGKIQPQVCSVIENIENKDTKEKVNVLLQLMKDYKPGTGSLDKLKEDLGKKLAEINTANAIFYKSIESTVAREFSEEFTIAIPKSTSGVRLSSLTCVASSSQPPAIELENKSIDAQNVKAIIWLATSYVNERLMLRPNQAESNTFRGIKNCMIKSKISDLKTLEQKDADVFGFVKEVIIPVSWGSPYLSNYDVNKVIALIWVIIQAERYLASGNNASVNQSNLQSFNKAVCDSINDVLSDATEERYNYPGSYCVTLGAILKLNDLARESLARESLARDPKDRTDAIIKLITKANTKTTLISVKSEYSTDSLKKEALNAVASSSKCAPLTANANNNNRVRLSLHF